MQLGHGPHSPRGWQFTIITLCPFLILSDFPYTWHGWLTLLSSNCPFCWLGQNVHFSSYLSGFTGTLCHCCPSCWKAPGFLLGPSSLCNLCSSFRLPLLLLLLLLLQYTHVSKPFLYSYVVPELQTSISHCLWRFVWELSDLIPIKYLGQILAHKC